MALYNVTVNPFTGKLQLVGLDASMLTLKGVVATVNDLPLTGNSENDCYVVSADDRIYTWNSSSSSGPIENWVDVGSVASVDWSAITNKPTSDVADIDDAVTKRHTQNTDTKLDEGGANEVSASDVKSAVDDSHTHTNKATLDATQESFTTLLKEKLDDIEDNADVTDVTNVESALASINANALADISSPGADIEDAVTKRHTQNTDTKLDEGGANEVSASDIKGTIQDDLTFKDVIDCSANPNYPLAVKGDLYRVSVAGKIGGNSGKDVDLSNFVLCIADSASGDEASVGTNWFVIGGDMRKSVYDSDGDGRVDEAEAINDGTNYATASDIKQTVDAEHTQNTDTILDEGGANEVSASQAKEAYTHKSSDGKDHADVVSNNAHRAVSSGNPHSVSKSDVALSNVPNLDTTNAVNKAHDQNTDTGTSSDDFAIGDGTDTDKTITADNGDANEPKIRYNSTTSKWQYTDNGVDWFDFGTAVGSGDMLKATYDTDDDGIVDKAESVDDGAGNSATASQVKSAVDDSHTHANKTLLDSYNQTNVNLTDAVTKKHTQNTDISTDSDDFAIGDGTDTNKSITANNGDANEPSIRYNASTNKWQLSNNGVDFSDIEAGTGSGDMLKSTYDTDDDGIVDKAESVDDGAGNSKTASEIKTHIDSTSNPHSVDKADVALSNVPNLDTTNAVNKAHDRQHAIDSASDHTSSITENNLMDADANGLPDDSGIAVSDVSDAVTKKHTQNTDTGTSSDDFTIGDGTDTTKTITVDNGDANEPKIRYNSSTSNWQYTDDGTNWYNFGVASGGAGSGDMTKATYDTDDNGIVDNSENLTLDATPSSDHEANGIKCEFTAGEALVFGDVCYLKSDGKYWKADADAIATGRASAMAIESISADASGDFLMIGIARDDTWAWTVGGEIYLSTTAGGMTQTAPSGTDDTVQILGIATHADRMYFKPSLDVIEHA